MSSLYGVGLGLRKPFLEELKTCDPTSVNFLEIAPENWMGAGGARQKYLEYYTQHYPVIAHGLSLSIGAPAPLDTAFVKDLKQFMDRYSFALYSEHLSYCSDEGQLYDLMPIPFTEEAVKYVSERVAIVQDILERRIALENISYYLTPSNELSEIDFINAILEEAQCDLLLDVNNVYVNSINHHYDANEFIQSLKPNKIPYIHIAGHRVREVDLLIDTHGADVITPVWELLKLTYETFGIIPTLLERDNNIPPLDDLLSEVDTIAKLQSQCEGAQHGD